MTPAEAIQNEIDREQKELDTLKDKAKELAKKLNGDKKAFDDLGEVLTRIINLDGEIDGRKIALKAVNAAPAKGAGAIDDEIEKEESAADKLGRRAQGLKEKAFKEEREGKTKQAKADREEGGRLSDQHEVELARIRGKRAAQRAIRRAAKG